MLWETEWIRCEEGPVYGNLRRDGDGIAFRRLLQEL